MTNQHFLDILVGALVTSLLLIIAHIALWPYRDRMHRVHNYVVGVSCISVGMLTASALMQQWIVFVTFVCVTLPGGLSIMAAWWVRGLNKTPADRISARGDHAVPAERGDRRN